MKKFILAASVAALFATGAQAQVESSYRPVGGSRTFEFAFAPLGANPINLNSGLRFRQFSSQTSAIRIGVFLGYMGDTERATLTIGEEEFELSDRMTELEVSLQGGIEKHFTGTERLSPYVALVGNVGFLRSSTTDEEYNLTDDAIYETKETQSTINVGVAGLLGFDYYIAEKLYIGAEAGIGLGYESRGDITRSSDQPGVGDTEIPGGSSIDFAPVYQGTLRLGFVF